jgi:hypothetical protein
VFLIERRYDPSGLVIEVYDYPEPSPGGREVGAVVAFSAWDRVVGAVIGTLDRAEDDIDMVEKASATLGEVEV